MTICAYIYIVEAACWFAGVSDTNFLFNCFHCHWMNYDIWHRALSQVIHTEQLAQFNTRDGRAADLLTNSTQNIFNTFILAYSCMSVAPGLKKFGYTTLESIRPSEMFRPRELQTSSYSPINIILVIASVGTCTYCVQMLLTIKILSSPKICVIVVVKMVYYSNTTTVWRHPKDARYIGF